MEENQNNNVNSVNENPVNNENQFINENQNNFQEPKTESVPIEETTVENTEEIKPKKRHGGIIATLIIIVICLLGLIVYDKINSKKTVIETCNVTFNADGGRPETVSTVENGKTVTKPTDPTKTGYKFVEWQLNGEKYDFNTPITTDLTLKATWEMDEKYFAVKSISKIVDGKKIDIVFPFYVNYDVADDEYESEEECANLTYDIYVNDKKIDSIDFSYGILREELNYYFDTESNWQKDRNIKSVVDKVNQEGISVIKDLNTEKEYLYIHKGILMGTSIADNMKEKLWIFDSDLNYIFDSSDTKDKNYYSLAIGSTHILNSRDCDEKFEKISTYLGNETNPVYDNEDGIHYLDPNYSDDETETFENEAVGKNLDEEVMTEFVISVKNGKVQKTKVKHCWAEKVGYK